jgi:hypothetical protein
MKAALRYYRWFGIRSSLLNNYKKGRFMIFLILASVFLSSYSPLCSCSTMAEYR